MKTEQKAGSSKPADHSMLLQAAQMRHHEPVHYERNISKIAASCGVSISELQKETAAVIEFASMAAPQDNADLFQAFGIDASDVDPVPDMSDIDICSKGRRKQASANTKSADPAPVTAPLQYIMASDIETDDETFDDELVERILMRHGMSVLYGDSNSGKTFLAVEMSACIARGQSFLGQRTEQGLVVYLATEGYISVRNRVKAYKKRYGLTDLDVVVVRSPVNLYESDTDAFLVIGLIKEVEARLGKKCVMVVGDTMSRIASGANENSGQDMGVVITNADRICQACDAHFLWIHHCGKDAARGMRGWSGIRAAIDTEIEVVESANKERSVEVTKQRDGEGKGDRYGFTLDAVRIGVNKWGVPRTSCVVMPADAPAKPTASRKGTSKVDRLIVRFFDERQSAAKRGDIVAYIAGVESSEGVLEEDRKGRTYIYNRIAALIKDGVLMDAEGIIQPTAWKP